MESDAQKERLRALFHAWDSNHSGRIEKWKFLKICSELHVQSADVDALFSKLDTDNDGTINLTEFVHGFEKVSSFISEDEMNDEVKNAEPFSLAWEDFKTRLGDQTKFIPRIDQVSTLYQNISLTEARMIPQYERVILNFIREIKLQNTDMENMALAVKRSQDQTAIQLSEMEEEMEQRVLAAERNTRTQVSTGQPARMFVIFSLSQQNQKLKQEVLESHTSVAFLQTELDSLKSDLTDQSINFERLANRKLHDSNDGLRTSLENSQTRIKSQVHKAPLKHLCGRGCDSLALALCDPLRRRRHSCELDSLPESGADSGMSTLCSNSGYDSEREGAGRSADHPDAGLFEHTSDTEVREGGRGAFLQKETDEQLALRHASDKTYKIVLAGDAAVGKSSFLLRLCKNEFKGTTSATLGVDFQMKTLVVDGVPTVLQLWDTAGQERFRSIAKSYFRRADGVLLLYDVTCEKSFLNVREWVDIIKDVSQDDIPIMLVGNKTDLRERVHLDGITCIQTSYGEKLAMTYSSLFCETSAKEGSNVIEAVLHLAREVIKNAHEHTEAASLAKLPRSHNKKPLNCCKT
uniref:EF-hand domain-containing protein n=1 Tax=Electrophorus electricus TaxID=8005 RepID=A0AAY5ENY8_ELEEL